MRGSLPRSSSGGSLCGGDGRDLQRVFSSRFGDPDDPHQVHHVPNPIDVLGKQVDVRKVYEDRQKDGIDDQPIGTVVA